MEPNYKGICIVLFNTKCSTDGHKVLKGNAMEFPNKCKVTKDFNTKQIVGEATNFRIDGNRLLCDLYIKDKIYTTVAPNIYCEIDNRNSIMTGLDYLAVVHAHAIKKLNNNLLKE